MAFALSVFRCFDAFISLAFVHLFFLLGDVAGEWS